MQINTLTMTSAPKKDWLKAKPVSTSGSYAYVTVNVRFSSDRITASSYIGNPDLGKVWFFIKDPDTLQLRLFKPEIVKRARHLIPSLKTWDGKLAMGELFDDVGGKKLRRFDTLDSATEEDGDSGGKRWRKMCLTLFLKIREHEIKDIQPERQAYTFIHGHPDVVFNQEFDTEDEANDSEPESRPVVKERGPSPHPTIKMNRYFVSSGFSASKIGNNHQQQLDLSAQPLQSSAHALSVSSDDFGNEDSEDDVDEDIDTDEDDDLSLAELSDISGEDDDDDDDDDAAYDGALVQLPDGITNAVNDIFNSAQDSSTDAE